MTMEFTEPSTLCLAGSNFTKINLANCIYLRANLHAVTCIIPNSVTVWQESDTQKYRRKIMVQKNARMREIIQPISDKCNHTMQTED